MSYAKQHLEWLPDTNHEDEKPSLLSESSSRIQALLALADVAVLGAGAVVAACSEKAKRSGGADAELLSALGEIPAEDGSDYDDKDKIKRLKRELNARCQRRRSFYFSVVACYAEKARLLTPIEEVSEPDSDSESTEGTPGSEPSI